MIDWGFDRNDGRRTPAWRDDWRMGAGLGRKVMDLKAGQAQMAQDAPDGGEQPAVSSDAPTKDERLDFLRQAIAFTEWTIRSFDTKAQISIAAFVLSMNPLWSILAAACPRAASSLIVAVLLVLFVATVLLFGFVIWPVTLTQSKLTGGWQTKGDRKSTRLNSSHIQKSRMPSSA